MAVHIRLLRMGKKRQPFYRIVAADSRRARDGRFLEILGTYNPIRKPAVVTLFEDRVNHWMEVGATPSDTVHSLLSQVGYLAKYDAAKRGQDVSAMELKTEITERKKKTRRMKKAAVAPEATAEAAPAEGGDAPAAEGGEAPAAEGGDAPAE